MKIPDGFRDFHSYWLQYVLQCLFATAAMFGLLLLLHLLNAVVVGSLGSTAFLPLIS
jgi:hypothetical protein